MASSDYLDFEPRNIFAAIFQLGLGGESPVLEDEFRGGQCRIFKLNFRDKESLAVRVPLYMSVCSQFEKIPVVKMEVEILQMLEAKGFRWAPKCRGYSLSFDNPLKHPFIVLTWIEGSRLPWNTSFPKQPYRDGLLRQIASIQLSLIECTLENRSTTAKAYFERLLKNRHIRVREGKLLDISNQDCVDQQGFLDHVLGQEQDSTIFAIEHGDLKPDNIIIDNKFHIQSIIDWGFAAFVPIARAAGVPRFLWPSLPLCRSDAIIQKDRLSYIMSLASQRSQAALYMQRWQMTADVDFHTLYLESLFSKGMHASLARIGWKIPFHKVIKHSRECAPLRLISRTVGMNRSIDDETDKDRHSPPVDENTLNEWPSTDYPE
ncbi:hypothetical protein F5B18DRAFT_665966 [Nemania serpens]|nr:hypothetical protein F5B18DRAFT_665966 [Nemania serpens]